MRKRLIFSVLTHRVVLDTYFGENEWMMEWIHKFKLVERGIARQAEDSAREHFQVWQSVQFSCSVVSDSLRPHESQHARPPCPSPTPRFHWDSCPSSQWCHPAISSSVVPNESTLRMRWPKYWSFSFSIILSKEHPGLISFRMDWLDLLAVQETFKSLLQYYSSKAPILWHSAFFKSNCHIHTWLLEKP